MEVQVSGGAIAGQTVDTIVVEVAEGQRRLTGAAAQVDAVLGGAIAELLAGGLISGRAGELTTLPARGALSATRVAIHGSGDTAMRTEDGFRARAGNLARALRGLNAGRVALSTQAATEHLDPEGAARALVEGFLLGLYRFDRHHTRVEDRPRGSVDALTLVPFGSFPHECYGLYHADYDHFDEYVTAINRDGVTPAVRAYLDRYVYGPASYPDYLDLFGGERLARQQRQAKELTS